MVFEKTRLSVLLDTLTACLPPTLACLFGNEEKLHSPEKVSPFHVNYLGDKEGSKGDEKQE